MAACLVVVKIQAQSKLRPCVFLLRKGECKCEPGISYSNLDDKHEPANKQLAAN